MRSGHATACRTKKVAIPTEIKAEFIRRLAATGLETIEVTSLRQPDLFPNWRMPRSSFAELGQEGVGPRRPVLVPNERGLDRALAAKVEAIAIFGSATETFAQKNLGRSVAESVEMFRPVVTRARDHGLWVRAYVSMCFGDPWEGPVPIAQVVDACASLMDLGADEPPWATRSAWRPPDRLSPSSTHSRRARPGSRADGGALPRHLRAGTLQHHDRPAPRHHDRRPSAGDWAAALRQERNGQPGDRGPHLGARGRRHRHRGGPEALVATSAWMAGATGRPAPSAVVRALAGPEPAVLNRLARPTGPNASLAGLFWEQPVPWADLPVNRVAGCESCPRRLWHACDGLIIGP